MGRNYISFSRGFQQEMTGITATPVVASTVIISGPVTKSAIGLLEVLQPLYAMANVAVDLGPSAVVEFHQLVKYELRENRRGGLLYASMRIMYQIAQAFLQVHCRQR